MEWPDEVAEGLPAPREDEPATLREDLVDELSDHLNCAMHRELRKHDAPEEAANRVRKRFGDPRAVLRKLWFDAMKEKIMSQRVTIVLVLVLACSSMAATAFAWVALRDGREAAAAMQQSNTAVLAKMTELLAARPSSSAAALPAANSDWTHVKFQLALDEPKDAPAVGYSVELYGKGGAVGETWVGKKTSDSSGEVDFGQLPAAPYTIQVMNGPFGGMIAAEPFLIPPREAFTKTVICPAQPVSQIDVSIDLENTSAIHDENAIILLNFVGQLQRKVGDWEWNISTRYYRAAFTTNGRLIHIWSNENDASVDESSPLWTGAVISNTQGFTVRRELWKEMISPPAVSPVLRLSAVDYTLTGIYLLPNLAHPPQSEEADKSGLKDSGNVTALRFSSEGTSDLHCRFTPVPGKKNVWKVRLPEEFIEGARKFIRVQDQLRSLQRIHVSLSEGFHESGDNFLSRIGVRETGEGTADGSAQSIGFNTAIQLFNIDDGSAAQAAKIQSGDMIVGLDKYLTPSSAELRWVSQRLKPNQQVRACLMRAGEIVWVELTVPGDWPPKQDSPPEKKELAPADPSANRLESPNSSAGDKEQESIGQMFFAHLGITKTDAVVHRELEGSKYQGGLVLQEIKADSTAANARLRPGDVLVGLDKYQTTSLANVGWISKNQIKDHSLKFHIVRDGKTLWGQLSVPRPWPPKSDVPAEKAEKTGAAPAK